MPPAHGSCRRRRPQQLRADAPTHRRRVFFCKQTTAYEGVPCDWSSDVCSSDLTRRSWARAAVCRLRGMLAEDDQIDGPFTQALEIGRASCRERVYGTV